LFLDGPVSEPAAVLRTDRFRAATIARADHTARRAPNPSSMSSCARPRWRGMVLGTDPQIRLSAQPIMQEARNDQLFRPVSF
jgi:hypothetical protein